MNPPGHRFARLGVALALAAGLTSCARPGAQDGLAALARPNLLLITIDTLRADRLPAYGFTGVVTPAIDRLAARGVVFEAAYSTTPLTLPSHTSLLSGLYPTRHGVRDNAGFAAPGELLTLAEVLAANGYRNGAFVSAFVLDSRWGLDQGFATYHDSFRLPRESVVAVGAVQRPANETVDAALAWLQESSDDPWFAWVHLYDPHTPYAPPAPFDREYQNDPYVGEIAFVDSQVARLTNFLRESGQEDTTLVLLTGDHGEGLGDHGEAEHGLLVYEESVRVPLILSTPIRALSGLRFGSPVSHVDVMPTLLNAMGIEAPEGLHGISLIGALDGTVPFRHDPVYFESWYARYHFGWSELRGVRDGDHKLILGPTPELFDLRQDPGELRDLATHSNVAFARLHRAIDDYTEAISRSPLAAGSDDLDPAARQRLASLGYLGGHQTIPADVLLPDPRARIGAYNRLLRARDLLQRQQDEEAERELRSLIAEEPRLSDALQALANLLMRQRRYAEVDPVLRSAIELRPDDAGLYAMLASSLIELGELDDAERTARDALSALPADARLYFTLGNIALRRANPEAAVEHYRRSIDLNPESSVAHATLASALLLTGALEEASERARIALALDSGVNDAHFVLGQVLQNTGDLPGAEREYRNELISSPRHLRATWALAVLMRARGDSRQERLFLEHALEIEPSFQVASLHLARLQLEAGSELEAAVHRVLGALDHPLAPHDRALACFLLADLYSRLGDQDASKHWAAEGGRIRGGRG